MSIGIDGRLWYESGVGRYIRNLVKGLEELNKNHEFTIFLNSEAFNNVIFSNTKFKKIKADFRWHTIDEQLGFKKIIESQNIDIVHFPYFSYPVFYKGKFIVTVHDLIIDHYPTGKSSSLPLPVYNFKRFAYKQITKNAIKKAEKIIVPSNSTLNELVDHYKVEKEKVNVIYEGFDPLINKKTQKNSLVSRNYILYVGNAYPHKNLDRLLNVFEKVRKEEEIDLILIGKKDFFYEKFENKVFRGVYFLHDVDDSLLFDYYTNARCTVIPSLMEGFGLPLLEAMSLSSPVISSNIDALKEIGGDACLYFNPENESEIYEAIKKIINDKSIKEALILKGKEQSKKFSWEKCVKETIKVYESCDSIRPS